MTRPKMLPNARETALRHVQRLRDDLAGQQVPDAYLAERAAAYVGAKTADVLNWMKGR